jgi:hypothetical protein
MMTIGNLFMKNVIFQKRLPNNTEYNFYLSQGKITSSEGVCFCGVTSDEIRMEPPSS